VKTNKFIGASSTASRVLLSVMSFEVYPFGAMMIIGNEEKCSTTAIPIEGKCTHGNT